MRVLIDDVEAPMPGGKSQSLFAFLLLYPRTAHTRDHLIDRLWPGHPVDRARRALADTLYRLRGALGGRLLVTTGEQVGLETSADWHVDVWEFEKAAAGGSVDDLDRARLLYAAPLLPDNYEDWILARRVALEEQFVALLSRRAQMAEASGDYRAARERYQELTEHDPLHEPSWRGLMVALARLGHLRDAVDTYARLVKLLEEELDAPPEEATQRLAEGMERELEAQRAAVASAEPTAFVGRARERAQLVALLDEAAAGRGNVAVVLGEAGIGRTALLSELEAAAGWRGLRVVWGHSEARAIPEPYAPLRQALLAALPPARLQQLEPLVPALWLDLLHAVLFETSSGTTAQAAPSYPPAEIAQAIASTLHALSRVTPHLILLDDLQWADPSLWHMLDKLRAQLAGARLLLVLSGRTGEMQRNAAPMEMLARWDQEAGAHVLTLGALQHPALSQILRARAPSPLSDSTVDSIIAASGGNPRLALALAEAGGSPEDGGAPAAIRQLVLRRYAALTPQAQTAIQAAAVLGTRFAYDHLRRMWETAGHPAAELPLAAGELERQRQLLLERETYTFVQSPLRDAIYEQMEDPVRQGWHRQAMDALRATPTPSPVALLRHADGAGDLEAVAEYAMLAAEAALNSHAYDSACVFFSMALKHISLDAPDTLYRVLLGRSRALGVLARRDEQGEDLSRLQTLAEQMADAGKRAQVACRQAGYLWAVGRLAQALQHGEAGLALAQAAGDLDLQAQLHEVIGRIHRDNKDADAAAAHIERAQRLYHSLNNRWGEALTTDLLGGLAWDSGRYADAALHHRTAADLFRSTGDIVREAQSLNNLGSAFWGLGDYAGARETHTRALVVCREAGDRRGEADNTDNLGGVDWSLGDYDTALQHYSAALRIRRAIADTWGVAISLGNIGSAWLCKAEPDRALEYYAESYPLYQQVGRRRGEGYVLHHMGLAELERGDLAAAHGWLNQARVVREQVGDGAKLAETEAAMARVALAGGTQAGALQCLESALARIDEHPPGATLRQEIHLAAYEVFAACECEEDALRHLAMAEAALDEICATLRPEEREPFLANVPGNRRLSAALQIHSRRQTVVCARASVAPERAPLDHELVRVTWVVETPADALIPDSAARRRHVLQRLAKQARLQGAAPTDDEFALALGVSRRTILRDISALAELGVSIPTRARKGE